MATQTVLIQIRFTEETLFGTYSDCLYFSESDYANIKASDVDQMMSDRVSNWTQTIIDASINNAKGPTQEDLIAQKLAIEAQIADLQLLTADVQIKIDDLESKKDPNDPGAKVL